MHNFIFRLDEFPLNVGREADSARNCLAIDEPFISRRQFALDLRGDQLWYINQSLTSLGLVDGGYPIELELNPDSVHIVQLGDLVIGLGTDVDDVYQTVADRSPDLFKAFLNGNEVGPLMLEHLNEGCEKGIFNEETKVYYLRAPDVLYNLGELLEKLRQGLTPVPCEDCSATSALQGQNVETATVEEPVLVDVAPVAEPAAEEVSVSVEETVPVPIEPAAAVAETSVVVPVPVAEPVPVVAPVPVAEPAAEKASVSVEEVASAPTEPVAAVEEAPVVAPVAAAPTPETEEIPASASVEDVVTVVPPQVEVPASVEPAAEQIVVVDIGPTAKQVALVDFEPAAEQMALVDFEPLPEQPLADFVPLPEQPLVDFEPRFE